MTPYYARLRRVGLAVTVVALLALLGGGSGWAQAPPPMAPGTIITVAGNGKHGSSGDGGPALNASIVGSGSIALDARGYLLIADSSRADRLENRVRKLSPYGIISSMAGSFVFDHAWDGGPRTAEEITNQFLSLAADTQGNLYIGVTRGTPTWNLRAAKVWKVSPDGTVITAAGGGRKTSLKAEGGPATEAALDDVEDVALDAVGNFFFVDGNAGVVWKVTPDGTLHRVAGGGKKKPVDADGGPATEAQLNSPGSITVDAAGNLFIAEYARVRKVSPDGIITTVAGGAVHPKDPLGDGGPATSAKLSPGGLAVDSAGNLFVTDGDSDLGSGQRVRKVSPDGVITTVAGDGPPGFSGDGGPATRAHLSSPGGVVVDAAGNLFFVDDGGHSIGAGQRVREVFGVGAPGLIGGRSFPAGDIDGDGAITVGDVVLALRIALKLLTPTTAQMNAADANGDGKVDLADAILILNRAIGL